MSDKDLILDSIKHCLKAKRLHYADVAKHLKMSVSSVKRVLSRGSLSLQRLEQIAELLEMPLLEIMSMARERHNYLTELTPEQETDLIKNPKLLLMAFLVINNWPLEDIIATYQIDTHEATLLLKKLDDLKIIEMLPFNRIRLLTTPNFTWRKNGPIQNFFQQQVQKDFLDSDFSGAEALLRFLGGTLSANSYYKFCQAIENLSREFNETTLQDSKLPLNARNSYGMVLAIRRWELSVFQHLRRQ